MILIQVRKLKLNLQIAEGIGNIVIKRKDRKFALIENVLFVPRMKWNLMSVGQLVEKGFSVIMKHDYLELYDQHCWRY